MKELKNIMTIPLIIITAIIFYKIGWIAGHHTVKTDCERIGMFYVGSKSFKCVEIKESSK
jgi:hypothetical protein